MIVRSVGLMHRDLHRAAHSVNHLLRTLQWRCLDENPLAGLGPLRDDQLAQERRKSSLDEVRAMFGHSRPHLRSDWLILMATGLRKHELAAQAWSQAERQVERLTAERGGLCGRLRDDHAELGRLAATSRPGDPRMVEAHDRLRDAERRVTQIDDDLASLETDLIDEREVAGALADFDAVWECLAPHEQSRVIELLVERVAYDGEGGNITITFRPSGIKSLAGELAQRKEETA